MGTYIEIPDECLSQMLEWLRETKQDQHGIMMSDRLEYNPNIFIPDNQRYILKLTIKDKITGKETTIQLPDKSFLES